MNLTVLPAVCMCVMLNMLTVVILLAHKREGASPHHLTHPALRHPLGLGWGLLVASPLLLCAVLLVGALVALRHCSPYYR